MPATAHQDQQVAVVILAGGGGRRMQGRDKGLIAFRGRTLIEHVIERLQPQSDRLLINCNRNAEEYRRFGYPLIADTLDGGLGPLAGLLSALEQDESELILCVPCDTPQLPADLIARMQRALRESAADACTVDDGDRLHPAILLVHRRVAPNLRRYLVAGKRKVHDWFYSIAHCSADFSDQPEAFININTPQQLEAAEKP